MTCVGHPCQCHFHDRLYSPRKTLILPCLLATHEAEAIAGLPLSYPGVLHHPCQWWSYRQGTAFARCSFHVLINGALPDSRWWRDAEHETVILKQTHVCVYSWWYGWRREILSWEFLPQVSFAKISSMQGKGYCSACSSGLTVPLKSPQILTDPSFFGIGSMGVAQSLQSTFVRVPLF